MNFVSGAALMYYEVRQALLQNGIKSIITKQGKRQKVGQCLLQRMLSQSYLTYTKGGQLFQQKGQVLQSGAIITKQLGRTQLKCIDSNVPIEVCQTGLSKKH